jgi:PAS domain S-box-containing protein
MMTRISALFQPLFSEEDPRTYITSWLKVGFMVAFVVAAAAVTMLGLALRSTSPLLMTLSLFSLILSSVLTVLIYYILREIHRALTEATARTVDLEQAAESMSLSREYLNNVIATMAGSLVVIGTDTTIKTVNQATLDLTGFTEAELVGKPIQVLMDLETFGSARDTLSKRGFVRHGERVYKTKDGRGVAVSFSSAIMRDSQKRVSGIVCVAQSISALKRVESELNRRVTQLAILQQVDEELTHILSVNRVLILALDMTTRLSAADAGGIALMENHDRLIAVQSIGYPSTVATVATSQNGIVERVVRRRLAELVLDVENDPDYIAVLSTTRAMIAIPLISQETLVGVLYLETSRSDRFTSEVFEFLKMITARIAVAADNAKLYDMTRRQVEELRDLYAQVSALEQMKTDMIRIAAHDLRNPLNSIMLSTRVLRKTLAEASADESDDRLKSIEEATERMRRITTNILSLERINKSVTGEFLALVDLQAVVREAFEDHRNQAQFKHQVYNLRLPETSTFVRGDTVELMEAVVNFITNALKYTPEYGRITVRLEQHDDLAVFEVRDTGYGIPEDQQERLFQPFFRVRSDDTAGIDGTGLGLHLVKQIIERHKGQVRFASKYGEGSIFGFELPLVRDVENTKRTTSTYTAPSSQVNV